MNKQNTVKWFRRAVAAVLLALVILLAMWFMDGGVSNRDVRASVIDEAASLRALLNARADAVDAKLDGIAAGEVALDAKLTRVEEKLDALLKLADRQLPDGMKRSE